jgi:uncharacterized protein with FMN-binding domain
MKRLNVILFILIVVMVFASCPIDDPVEPKGPSLEGIKDGTATGLGVGYAADLGEWGKMSKEGYSGDKISVTITVASGYFTDVNIIGDDESPNFGRRIIQRARSVILKKNTFDLVESDIEGVSGSTLTFNGIIEAGNNALDQLRD